MLFGLEVLLEKEVDFGERKIGLVTNHTAVNGELQHAIELLAARNYGLRKIFTPEHGLYGFHAAGETVGGEGGSLVPNGAELVSLYGERRAPTRGDLEDLDLVIYDMQDVGTRFYTYIYTLANVLRVAGEMELPFYVLDRPDPLGGKRVRGAALPPDHHSFVGDFQLPVRYGLTPGELALYLQGEFGLGGELHVVEMEGWERKNSFDRIDRPWVPPSPNIPDYETARLYPGTCLFEGVNLSEGRGTTLPFKVFGAPWLRPDEVRERLRELVPSPFLLRETRFRPHSSKYEGEVCSGFQIHFRSDPDGVIELVGNILWLLKRMYPKEFRWRKGEGQGEGSYFIDRLTGTGGGSFRQLVDQGADRGMAVAKLLGGGGFGALKERYHLY